MTLSFPRGLFKIAALCKIAEYTRAVSESMSLLNIATEAMQCTVAPRQATAPDRQGKFKLIVSVPSLLVLRLGGLEDRTCSLKQCNGYPNGV